MALNNKSKVFALLIITTSLIVGSFSVAGLLQSTEKVSSSGVIIRPSPPVMQMPSGSPLTPPPPEPKIEINLYSDSDCRNRLSTIKWGDIIAGKSAAKTIYIKNEGTVEVILSLDSENWNPSNIENNLLLDWDYNGDKIQPGTVIKIILNLSVSKNSPEVSTFAFDVIIVAS